MLLMRVVGARPQFMQEVVFRREIDKRGHIEILVHTGQHYDERMCQIFFDELKIPKPDVNLGVGSGSHGMQTGRMLERLDEVIREYNPDAVVVDGDTNSTLAGALSAAKLHVPVIHVEAGLRSFDRKMPEEINRIVTDHLGMLLCAPTKTAISNLAREGLDDRAELTGDLMYDCFLHFHAKADNSILDKFNLKQNAFLLATIHRSENIENEERFTSILLGFCELPLLIFLPAHPRIRKKLETFFKRNRTCNNIQLSEPVSYLQMLALEKASQCILTDSGGVQREAFFAGKTSLILRDSTEWREQVESGWSYLAGSNPLDIQKGYRFISANLPLKKPEVYGDGRAAEKVIAAIERTLS
jgi:UDP-GlcNAc3NAcA epimerase